VSTFWTNDPLRNAGVFTTHDPTVAQGDAPPPLLIGSATWLFRAPYAELREPKTYVYIGSGAIRFWGAVQYLFERAIQDRWVLGTGRIAFSGKALTAFHDHGALQRADEEWLVKLL
jgi:hypothetical protein